MKIKFCLKCKSTDLIMIAGGKIGMYECKKCRYRASIFPEKEIKIKIKKKSREKSK